MHYPLKNQCRADFPLLNRYPELHYLDSAATTQKPRAVIEAVSTCYESAYGPVHRSLYGLGETATAAYEGARRMVARFLGAAEAASIVFTRHATEALNLAAWIEAPNLERGDEIILSVAEHHSNLLPWQRLACKRGLKLTWVPVTDSQELDGAALLRALSPTTKLVALTHVSNVLGSVTPLASLIPAIHEVGAKIVVDAAQSVGRFPIDVHELEADYLAFSGHKVYGPDGIGVLYAKPEHLDKAEPLHVGGGMVAQVTLAAALWRQPPHRFEAGSPPLAAAVGLQAALEYLMHRDQEALWEQEQALTTYALGRLAQVPGLRIFGPPPGEGRAGIISFTLTAGGQRLHSHDVVTVADGLSVALRGGHHCAEPLLTALGEHDVCRASLGVYSTEADINALEEALREAVRRLRLPRPTVRLTT